MVSQAGRWIALIERITNRHKREPQAGTWGSWESTLLVASNWASGRAAILSGDGGAVRLAICFEYDLVLLGRKLHFDYAAI
jgi:hypothetical protein